MFIIKTVSQNIKYARLFRNYSQTYLAEKLNMSQNGYSKIELGYTQISLENFLIIADVLDVDIMDLLSDHNTFLSYLRSQAIKKNPIRHTRTYVFKDNSLSKPTV
jgi:transcriptional regulator with XRE-family HTH domain